MSFEHCPEKAKVLGFFSPDTNLSFQTTCPELPLKIVWPGAGHVGLGYAFLINSKVFRVTLYDK